MKMLVAAEIFGVLIEHAMPFSRLSRRTAPSSASDDKILYTLLAPARHAERDENVLRVSCLS
jgi:hypothetical protein